MLAEAGITPLGKCCRIQASPLFPFPKGISRTCWTEENWRPPKSRSGAWVPIRWVRFTLVEPADPRFVLITITPLVARLP